MNPCTPADLQRFVDQNEIRGEIVQLDVPTPTVETAARAVAASPEQIVKSVLFLVGGEKPVLAIACGTTRIDRRPIARHCGVGRKRVKLADAEAVLRITGYPAGGVPPFGHPVPIESLLDPAVLEHAGVYAGGGSEDTLLRFDPQDLLRLAMVKVVPLIEP